MRGLTTAATLWVVAAIGVAAGAGYYSAAVLGALLVLLSLWPLRIAAHRVLARFRPEDGRLLVGLPAGARVDALQLEHGENERLVVAAVRLPLQAGAAPLVERVGALEGMRRVEWTA